MDSNMIGQIPKYLIDSLLYRQTGNAVFDDAVYWSSFFLEILAVVGVMILVLRNEPVRKRIRPLDRLIFWECVIVFCENVLQISMVPLSYVEDEWAAYVFNVVWTVNEVLYLLLVLQWLVCVDYCLYFSVDHIRRHYRKAAIPIVVIAVLDICETVVVRISASGLDDYYWWPFILATVLYVLKFIVEAGYILTAIYIVRKHSKESREPHFLRLEAFIIPFVFGVLFRFFDASFAGFGVILTYAAIKRRDRYIDLKTGLYNEDYLDRICDYWNKKGFVDGSALCVSAAGHGSDLAGILGDISIPGSFVICMGEEKYVLIAGFLRGSAFSMAEDAIIEAAKEADIPFEPETVQMRRNDGETMTAFGARIKETCRKITSER